MHIPLERRKGCTHLLEMFLFSMVSTLWVGEGPDRKMEADALLQNWLQHTDQAQVVGDVFGHTLLSWP